MGPPARRGRLRRPRCPARSDGARRLPACPVGRPRRRRRPAGHFPRPGTGGGGGPPRAGAGRLAFRRRLRKVARKARLRCRAAAHQAPASRVALRQPEDPLERPLGRELLALLDEEGARLPERYRLPRVVVVACSWRGRSVEESARLLGWKAGLGQGDDWNRLPGRRLLQSCGWPAAAWSWRRLLAVGLAMEAGLPNVAGSGHDRSGAWRSPRARLQTANDSGPEAAGRGASCGGVADFPRAARGGLAGRRRRRRHAGAEHWQSGAAHAERAGRPPASRHGGASEGQPRRRRGGRYRPLRRPAPGRRPGAARHRAAAAQHD